MSARFVICRNLLLVLAVAPLGGCERAGKPSTPESRPVAPAPNILLISVDTLRPDHLGTYGYARKTSPRIDQFAAEGVVFENTISSTSWTLPAHCALFTGLPDSVHGCLDMDQRLDASRTTMAERLKAAGYATVGFYAAPALHPVFGVDQGFDEYIDCTSYTAEMQKRLASHQSIDTWEMRDMSHADIANPRVYAAVKKWLSEHAQRPFFMFVHLWDVHADYIPPVPYDTMFDPNYDGPVTGRNFATDKSINASMPARDREHLVALYDGEIAWTDMHVGMILDELAAQNLVEKTIVALFSDHGDEHFEHGRKGHRQTLYDEVIRIALIVRYPQRIRSGLRIREQARIIDILPTVFELAGLPAPAPIVGQSLVPPLAGKPLAHDNLAIAELFSGGRELRAYRRLDQKMIYDERTRLASIFKLVTDPGERTTIDDPNEAVCQALIRDAALSLELLENARGAQPPITSGSIQLPESVSTPLESLGYLRSPQSQPADETP